MEQNTHDYKTRVAEASVRLVRQVLADRGWRPARLAEVLQVHPDLVRRWLRGERKPQLDDMLHMCTMVGASMDELLGLRDQDSVELAPAQLQQLAEQTGAEVVRRLAAAILATSPAAERTVPGSGATAFDAREKLSRSAQEALDKLISRADEQEPQRRWA